MSGRIEADLERSKLFDSDHGLDDYGPGSIDHIELSRPTEDPEKVTVIVGVSLPCGYDDAVYVYDYSQERPRRILESHGTRRGDQSISDVRFSKRDAIGDQLILALRYAVQCASTWNHLSYDLFRLSTTADTAVAILGGQHGVWIDGVPGYQVRLNSGELLIELRDRSIDAGIHNRAHVLHFQIAGATAERIDPVALQPQDFVDEWLMRPWTEMESRSAEDGRDKLKKWHEFVAGDFVAGDFQFVQQCEEKPDEWQVGVDLDWIHDKELPESLGFYFLVRQSGQYGFKMMDISFDRQDGCPGESFPSSARPTLFPLTSPN